MPPTLLSGGANHGNAIVVPDLRRRLRTQARKPPPQPPSALDQAGFLLVLTRQTEGQLILPIDGKTQTDREACPCLRARDLTSARRDPFR